MNSKIHTMLLNSISFSTKETNNILITAVNQLNAEKKYNFDLNKHKQMFIKNPINEGCGCEYCKMRYKLKITKIHLHIEKKKLERIWDYLSTIEKEEHKNLIILLEKKIKNIKLKKNIVKIELGLK